MHHSRLAEFGQQCGAPRTREWARQANENPPRLKSFDRYGRRLDEVHFHPAYHRLMTVGLKSGISGCAWSGEPAGHVLHGAMMMLMTQADAGVTCPMSMSDGFLTLAQAPEGLTCFLVPRWRPDGERNAIRLMRLKDKLGDRSNASAEIEYHGAWAQRVGDEGRGVATIIGMVQLTRYDCALGSAGGIRAALVRALWHAAHRRAFGKALIDHPAMRAVLADLILESAAAT